MVVKSIQEMIVGVAMKVAKNSLLCSAAGITTSIKNMIAVAGKLDIGTNESNQLVVSDAIYTCMMEM